MRERGMRGGYPWPSVAGVSMGDITPSRLCCRAVLIVVTVYKNARGRVAQH